jgi:DNA adenine methylase
VRQANVASCSHAAAQKGECELAADDGSYLQVIASAERRLLGTWSVETVPVIRRSGDFRKSRPRSIAAAKWGCQHRAPDFGVRNAAAVQTCDHSSFGHSHRIRLHHRLGRASSVWVRCPELSDAAANVTDAEDDRSDVYQKSRDTAPAAAGSMSPQAVPGAQTGPCGRDEAVQPLLPRSPKGSVRLLSPLRYPGAKRQLIPLFDELLRYQAVSTFIEPFAGGASVSLHVAANGLADRVVLGEADPLVYHFWQTACFETDWLINQVETVEVSLETWDRFRASDDESSRAQALACLFLNRTSFSGILHRRAGPIGGRAQRSAYGLGCRFPREELVRRLRLVGRLAGSGRIAAVYLADYEATVAKALAEYGSEGSFIYLDPPFFAKAATLYRRSFLLEDHHRLARYLTDLNEPWVLSYDDHLEIRNLYSVPPELQNGNLRHHLATRTLHYTAHSRRGSGDEFLVTNVPALLETIGMKAST